MRKVKRLISTALLFALMFSTFVLGGGSLLALPVSASSDGFEFNSATGTLTIYTNNGTTAWKNGHEIGLGDVKSVIIGENVTSIGDFAFRNCTNLESVSIGSGVIGSSAFEKCGKLSSVTIGSGVTSIESFAFQETGLTSIVIPDSVTSIGIGAFWSSSSLESVTIGSGVENIGNWAFQNCTILTSVTFLGTPPTTFATDAFGGTTPHDELKIIVPKEALEKYKTFFETNSSIGINPDNIIEPPDEPEQELGKEETNTSPYIFTPPPVYAPPVVEDEAEEIAPEPVVVDDTVVQMIERGGILYVTLTAGNIAALRSDDGVVTLDLTGHDDIRLSFADTDGLEMLVIITDFGTIRLPGAMLRAMRGDTVVLRLGKD